MRNVFFVLTGVLLFFGCQPTRRISSQNLAHLYKKESSFIHPSFVVHHENDNTSRLYFKVDSEELLYTRQGTNSDFTAQLRISYRLTPSWESTEIVDSASTLITDTNNENVKKAIIGSIDVKAVQGNTYVLRVKVKDTKRNQEATAYINVDKSGKYSGQNYMVTSPGTGVPVFRNYIGQDEQVKVTARHDAKELVVRYYNRDFPVAPPPFSVVVNKSFDYKADSIFTVQLDDERSAIIMLPQTGLYHFLADTNTREGLTLSRFQEPFPEIASPRQLIAPLRYITSREEFEDLMAKDDKKAAADNFWLKMTGSPERAKEVIRKFYNRVQDANIYFTSYLEGWKTDRGMIYIIYGAPNVVYQSNNGEVWVYGEDKNLMSLSFTFVKVVNPFTDNDLSLERSTVYKNSWYRALDIWRQGRVYLEN